MGVIMENKDLFEILWEEFNSTLYYSVRSSSSVNPTSHNNVN